MAEVLQRGRSLAETPTYSVASVVTIMVFVCFLVERSIYRFGKWLQKTRRKALYASLEKMKEELMLLGLISLMLAQCARWISEMCVKSSLFNSEFYICADDDKEIGKNERFMLGTTTFAFTNNSGDIPEGLTSGSFHLCPEGHEPFVSYEGLEQLHRFLFVLGITHVLYSCLAVGLAMSKIYSWRRWENQAAEGNLPEKKNKVMRRQTTFVFHHTSHPWSRNPILIWMLCFLRQFRSSIQKSDYLALRQGFITKHKLPLSYNFHKYMVRSMEDEFHGILGISWPLWGYAIICIFVNIHGLNIYFWLSFIPVILVILIGTKLQHVVSTLALEIREQTGPSGTQVKPRDDLFWFNKPEILLWLIQFVIFQNAFEMATYIWSLWGLKERSCLMRNQYMIIIRLASGVVVQFWCSYMTVPLNVIVSQMGSRWKKAVVAESVRDSLHSWCKRVKQRSKHDSAQSHATRSVCSLESTIDERDEITVVSGTLTRSSSMESLNQITVTSVDQLKIEDSKKKADEYLSKSIDFTAPPQDNYDDDEEEEEVCIENGDCEEKVETLLDLFQKNMKVFD